MIYIYNFLILILDMMLDVQIDHLHKEIEHKMNIEKLVHLFQKTRIFSIQRYHSFTLLPNTSITFNTITIL